MLLFSFFFPFFFFLNLMKVCLKTDFLWGFFQTLYKTDIGPGGFFFFFFGLISRLFLLFLENTVFTDPCDSAVFLLKTQLQYTLVLVKLLKKFYLLRDHLSPCSVWGMIHQKKRFEEYISCVNGILDLFMEVIFNSPFIWSWPCTSVLSISSLFVCLNN